MDVNGDGVDEIVVSRGQGRNKSNPELIWLEQVPDQEHFEAHRIDPFDQAGNWQATHDIEVLEVETFDGRVRGDLNRGDFELERTVRFEGEGTHEMPKAPIRIDQVGPVRRR